jgi:hypothetical protein
MAIRLSFDVIGSTCGDLLRFTDAVRASGTSPEVPLQQGGPNRIDIVDDRGGQYPGQVPPFPPDFSYQSHHGHQSAPSYEPPRRGGTIEVNWGGRSRRTELSIETVNELHAVLGRALESADLDDSVRAALRNLREAFSGQE